MGILSSLLQPGKIVEKAIDVADRLNLSDQERLNASLKAYELWVDMEKQSADENSIKALTRRYLSCASVGLYLVLLLATAIVGQVSPDHGMALLNVAKQLDTFVLLVGGFYFGGFALGYLRK